MVHPVNARLRALQRGPYGLEDPEAPSPLDRPIRREHAVNWGDRSRLGGRKPQTLAWVSLESARPIIVYAHATPRSGSPICLVTIEWGHGGASVVGEYRVIKRLRVPLAASMVKVSGRLIDPTTGASAAPSDAMDVSCFVAEGEDGTTLRNTRWVNQQGATGTIDGPQRLMKVEGFNPGASTFVQLFDGGAPDPGATPAILIPAPSGRRFRCRRFDSQGFSQALVWGCSSTPLSYTAQSTTVRVDLELLL
jgi:hypothetical protein